MRVNVYAEEMTDRVEIVNKNGFTGLRFYLALPASFVKDPGQVVERPATAEDKQQATHRQAPFIHHPGDDDSSAVTFWGKKDLRTELRKALALLDAHYDVTARCGHPKAHPATGYECVKCGIWLDETKNSV